MNDETKFTEEELESMADKFLEEASANDIASQQETELPKPRKRAKKKENAEPPKSPDQVLQELLDKGVKITQVNGRQTAFSILPADGSYKVNFGAEEFENWFKSILRPQLVETLF